jgi:hypothetical protein
VVWFASLKPLLARSTPVKLGAAFSETSKRSVATKKEAANCQTRDDSKEQTDIESHGD